MASFVVVYDACVLYPFHLRDLLVRLAMSGLFQANLVDLAPARVAQVLTEQAAALDAPPLSLEDLLRLLRRDGLTAAMAALEEYRG